MQPDSYKSLSTALQRVGLLPLRQRPHQLVVSCQQGPVWPNRGNSFWLSHRRGIWYLSTWSPLGYEIPADQDVVALCSACMAVGDSAMYRVPADIVATFGLRQLDDEEY